MQRFPQWLCVDVRLAPLVFIDTRECHYVHSLHQLVAGAEVNVSALTVVVLRSKF